MRNLKERLKHVQAHIKSEIIIDEINNYTLNDWN